MLHDTVHEMNVIVYISKVVGCSVRDNKDEASTSLTPSLSLLSLVVVRRPWPPRGSNTLRSEMPTGDGMWYYLP